MSQATICRFVVASFVIVALAVTVWSAFAHAGPTPTPTAIPTATPTASTGSVVGWGDDSYGQATPLDAVNGVSGTAPSSTRTTNLIERLNKRFKRRTEPMEIVAGENSVYTLLAFVAMKMEVSWRNAPFRNSGFRKLTSFAGYFTHES